MNVLIVDDSPTMRHVVQKVVANSMFTCEITHASDGANAIMLCKRLPFDAILLDCNMPDVDGFTTLRKLRAIRPDVRVVMISADDDPEKERLALQGGASAFLQSRSIRRTSTACCTPCTASSPQSCWRSDARRRERDVRVSVHRENRLTASA